MTEDGNRHGSTVEVDYLPGEQVEAWTSDACAWSPGSVDCVSLYDSGRVIYGVRIMTGRDLKRVKLLATQVRSPLTPGDAVQCEGEEFEVVLVEGDQVVIRGLSPTTDGRRLYLTRRTLLRPIAAKAVQAQPKGDDNE
jgi:hypothetical protein